MTAITDALGRTITITPNDDGVRIDYHVIGSGPGWAQDFIACFPAGMAQDDAIAAIEQTSVPAPLVPLPAVVVPLSVSRFQALAVLMQTPSARNPGRTMLDDATAAVTAAGGLTLLAWQNAQVFERNGPLLTQMGAALGVPPAQIDALFVAAAQISA